MNKRLSLPLVSAVLTMAIGSLTSMSADGADAMVASPEPDWRTRGPASRDNGTIQLRRGPNVGLIRGFGAGESCLPYRARCGMQSHGMGTAMEPSRRWQCLRA